MWLELAAYTLLQAAGLQARLLTPLSSSTPKGTPFELRVIGSLDAKQEALPAGTRIEGTVEASRTLGLGFRHDRALLRLRFDRCLSPTNEPLPCQVELDEVDNARESVRRGNTIRGILAGSHPHGFLRGLWFRPNTGLLRRSAEGLTGATGHCARLIPGWPGFGAAIGVRLLLFRMPDAEIRLPAGTDLLLRATSATTVPPPAIFPPPAEFPTAITHVNGRPAGDIINFVFTAPDRATLEQAFGHAGWLPAQPLGKRTAARTYAAYTGQRGYPEAPVSPLLYQGQRPALVFQKSLNTIARRHHVRLWPGADGEWRAAATHDIGITFDLTHRHFTHAIDPRLDRERQTLLNDLRAAGCVAEESLAARPGLATPGVTTDGALAQVRLQPCTGDPALTRAPERSSEAAWRKPVRRLMLETRWYVTRGNAYYWAWRGVAAQVKKPSPELALRR